MNNEGKIKRILVDGQGWIHSNIEVVGNIYENPELLK